MHRRGRPGSGEPGEGRPQHPGGQVGDRQLVEGEGSGLAAGDQGGDRVQVPPVGRQGVGGGLASRPGGQELLDQHLERFVLFVMHKGYYAAFSRSREVWERGRPWPEHPAPARRPCERELGQSLGHFPFVVNGTCPRLLHVRRVGRPATYRSDRCASGRGDREARNVADMRPSAANCPEGNERPGWDARAVPAAVSQACDPGTGADVVHTGDGRRWRIGTANDVGWIAGHTTPSLSVTAAIPPVFDAYATFHPPDGVSLDAHEHAVVHELAAATPGQSWWLGYLDTGAHDVVFPHAAKVSLYWGWSYVLVEAGPRRRPSPGGPVTCAVMGRCPTCSFRRITPGSSPPSGTTPGPTSGAARSCSGACTAIRWSRLASFGPVRMPARAGPGSRD